MRLDLYLEQILSYTFFYMNRLSELSVFFPAYNEEANLRMVVEKAINYLPKIAQKWEVLIVDDGSKDKTGEIADSLAKEYRQIRVIHHRPNRGYGAAFKSGFYNAKYEWIAFTDSDGQFDFRDIDKAWKVWSNMEIGPFELMDQIGLDTVYDIEMSYYLASNDPKDKPPEALLEKIKKGELGVKSGKGFYSYTKNS